ncbi:MAG: response regulator [bacterium]|nr:response regulator [Candidatus Kapabacteria bacterium]
MAHSWTGSAIKEDDVTMDRDATNSRPGVPTVLIADDDAVSRMMSASLFRRSGYSVDTAIDGLEAVEASLRMRYDVIVVDLQMPQLDGYAAVRRMRSSGIASHIVALTATLDDRVRSECENAGFDRVVEKPINENVVANIASDVHIIVDLDSNLEVVDDNTVDLSDSAFENFRREVTSNLTRPFASVIDEVLTNLRDQCTALINAARDDNRADITRLAHTLRGGASTIGARRLATRVAAIERNAPALTQHELTVEVHEAVNDLDRLVAIVQTRRL